MKTVSSPTCLGQGENRDIYAVWPTDKLLNEKAKYLCNYMSQYINESLPKK